MNDSYPWAPRSALGMVNNLGELFEASTFEGLTFQAIEEAPDGTLYVATSKGIARVEGWDAPQLVPICETCLTSWLKITDDGTIWFGGGFIPPGAAPVAVPSGGHAPTIGPDGRIWVAGPGNAVGRIADDGSVREILLPVFQDVRTIASWRGALWYPTSGAIRSVDPSSYTDLRLRRGDVVTLDVVLPPFEPIGFLHTLVFHGRGKYPFGRVAETAWQEGALRSVWVADLETVVVTRAGSMATLYDVYGRVQSTLIPHDDADVRALVIDAAGRMHALDRRHDGQFRLVTFDREGNILRDTPVALGSDVHLSGADLAADQCTLYYTARRFDGTAWSGDVGRLDVCTGLPMEPVLSGLADIPQALRVLPDGSLLVASRSIEIYDVRGMHVRQVIAAPATGAFSAMALDVDARSVWVNSGGLERIDLTTGEVLEQRDTYGDTVSISVVGEPRAARMPQLPRRRAAGR
jgi:hypothetical protein